MVFLSMCYIINKAIKFKSDTSKLVKSLKNLICKDYELATISLLFAINLNKSDGMTKFLVNPTNN